MQLEKTGITKRTALLVALLGAALTPACGRISAQVSLATVVDLAQRNSSAVRLADADQRRAAAALSESKDVVIPSLTFSSGVPVFPSAGFSGTPSSIWSGTVESQIFSVPQQRYINSARSGLLAAEANLKDAREQAALEAATAYLELDTVSQEMSAAYQQEAGAGRMVEIEKQRAEAGVDPLNDLLEAQLAAAQIRLKRIHLQSRTATLVQQLATLTGLPVGSITPDHASIPEIPPVSGELSPRVLEGVQSARLNADSKFLAAKGDYESTFVPQFSFVAQYNRNTTILNNADYYYAHPIPTNNFSSGISIQVPVFDLIRRAKARQSAAEALRAKVEAEQAEHQNDVAIASLTGSIRELDALAEIAKLKQEIAENQLKTVQTQLQFGSGSGTSAQLSPKSEELARIDGSQKQQEALDAGFDLAKARLNLLRALGHMDDWLRTLNK
jgi:outer membrane protein TolC